MMNVGEASHNLTVDFDKIKATEDADRAVMPNASFAGSLVTLIAINETRLHIAFNVGWLRDGIKVLCIRLVSL